MRNLPFSWIDHIALIKLFILASCSMIPIVWISRFGIGDEITFKIFP